MDRLSQLLPASWKGIPFLTHTEVQTEGGRRIVLHDYPNSSVRYVEDQGLLPPRFTLTAFVTGYDFLDRADQLERALKEPGRGRLSMPVFGSRVLFALPYRKDVSQKDVGEIRFELEFVSGRDISGPSHTAPTSETVYVRGDEARDTIEDALADLWLSPVTTSDVLSAQFDLTQYTKSIEKIATVASNAADIAEETGLIDTNAATTIRNGADLATAFIGKLWQTVSEGLSGGIGEDILKDLSKFGAGLSLSLSDIKNASVPASSYSDSDTIPLWQPTTAQRIARNQNRLSLVNSGRISALVLMYEQAADTDYQTNEEIEETRLTLETEHQRLMRVDTEDKTLIQSQASVRQSIENVRLAALRVLDQKEQAAFNLTTVNAQVPISAFVLSYNLYAESFTTSMQVTKRGIELRELNLTQPSDRMFGKLTALQT